MTFGSMSRFKRLLLAFSLFVLIPALYQIIMSSTSRNSQEKSKKEPTIEASQSSIHQTCFDVRKERNRLEEINDVNRNKLLNEINLQQKTLLLNELTFLYDKNLIDSTDWNRIQALVQLANSSELPVSPFAKEYISVNDILASLIEEQLIKPYYDKEIVSLGEKLASTPNPELVLINKHPACFESWEVDFAKSFLNLEVKSNWGNKKSSNDFMQILTYKSR